jgi:hypothetical protein
VEKNKLKLAVGKKAEPPTAVTQDARILWNYRPARKNKINN